DPQEARRWTVRAAAADPTRRAAPAGQRRHLRGDPQGRRNHTARGSTTNSLIVDAYSLARSIRAAIGGLVSSAPSDREPTAWATESLATQLAALQAELVAIKAEATAKVASLEDTIANLAHENALLKRRLYGNRTERSQTSEMQLALGDLLAGET